MPYLDSCENRFCDITAFNKNSKRAYAINEYIHLNLLTAKKRNVYEQCIPNLQKVFEPDHSPLTWEVFVFGSIGFFE